METLIKNIFRRKTSDDLVREIHNEFDTAGDKLLNQAKSILEEIAKSNIAENLENKAKIMEQIGFINSKFVKDVNNKIKNDKQAKEDAEKDAQLVMYYKHKYPNLKFLKENDLDTICEKYNLVYAPIKNYVENVPDKNLNDIIDAKELDVDDKPDCRYYYTNINSDFFSTENKLIASKIKIEIDKQQFLKPETRKHNFRITDGIPGFHNNMDNIPTYASAIFVSNYLIKHHGIRVNERYISLSKVEVDYSGLFICAPEKHFNLEGLSKEKKYGFFEKITTQIVEVKDPIVFRYVKGGIQVITKWGIEAEDRLLAD